MTSPHHLHCKRAYVHQAVFLSSSSCFLCGPTLLILGVMQEDVPLIGDYNFLTK